MTAVQSSVCWCCWDPLSEGEQHHAACLRRLFGKPNVPAIEVDPASYHLFGAEMAGHITLSGVQRKLSLGWHHRSLRVTAERSSFILKPGESAFPALPENECLTMALARDFGLKTAHSGLVELAGGTRALLVRRFDRVAHGHRVHMEDFCQLAEQDPAQKYEGSAELCMRIIREFATDPGVQCALLFRRLLFAWWVGDGDLHLKNLSVLRPERGRVALAPVYDAVNTTILLPNEQLALPLHGKRSRLDRLDWLAFGDYAKISPRLVIEELARPQVLLETAQAKVSRSLLPESLRKAYMALLVERANSLD